MNIFIDLDTRKNYIGGNVSLTRGVNVLVGENGSGKSSVLESLFKKITEDNTSTLERIICFSSGPNQNFSEIYDLYRKREKRNFEALKTLNLRSFLFQQEWAPILICFAAFISTRENPTLVSKFLGERGYLIDDLILKVRIKKDFILRVSSSFQKVQKDSITDYDVEKDFSSSCFVQIIEKITGEDLANVKRGFSRTKKISTTIEGDQLNDAVVAQTGSQVSAQLYSALLELTAITGNTFNETYERGSPKRKMNTIKLLGAFALAALNDSLIDITLSELNIKKTGVGNGFKAKYLSDGEFQLLMTYAIIDLFDDPSTVLVMDEVDSHVHQQIIPKLWSCFNSLKGYLVTTTHNPTSLKYSDFSRVMAIKAGLIQTGFEFTKQLSSIFDCKEAENRVLCLGFRHQENLVVIDGYKDWVIFNELAKVKLGDRYDRRLESNVFVYQVTSSQDVDLTHTNAKVAFIKKMERLFHSDLTIEQQRQKKLKKVLFLYDRDNRNLSGQYKNQDIYNVVSVAINHQESRGPHNISATHLFWHFREIENYLLIDDILMGISQDIIVGKMGTTNMEISVRQVLDAVRDNNDELIAQLDCKDFITSLIKREDGDGIDFDRLRNLISDIRPDSISGYIEKMHNKIAREIFR